MAFQAPLLVISLLIFLANFWARTEFSLAAKVPFLLHLIVPYFHLIFFLELPLLPISTKVHGMKMAKDQVFGILLPTLILAEKISDGSNGDIALDFYHRYKEDVKLAKSEGLDAFRFSIAWARILPQGKLSKGVNQVGIDYYNNLINEIIAHGIKPVVTLFHWDLPQALEDEYLGFLSPKILDDYLDLVEICFNYFGDRVKLWTTINEPWIFASNGYDAGSMTPGRCSAWRNNNCSAGNSATEPYIVDSMLLAHGAAAKLYRQKYKLSLNFSTPSVQIYVIQYEF